MTNSESPRGDPAAIAAVFRRLPALLDADKALIARGRLLDVACLLGPIENPYHVVIAGGRIVDLAPAPILMRSWRFGYRASPKAWSEFWRHVPRPGWHDLLALTKRGEAVLEGDLLPFMMHLQYFKDVLALPRGNSGAAT